MATQLQIRRGTNTQNASFTGAEGELSANTTNDSVHVHDGSTAGGFELARADFGNVSTMDGVTIGGSTPAAGTFTTVTADGGVSVDNITIDGTEIDLSSGDLTLDVAGNIRLDADDAGEVRYLDGGTHYATIKKDGNNTLLQSIVADGDLIIQGIDGASFVTAMTFDMSEGGNVGIGTSSPHSSGASFTVLNLNGTKGGSLAFSRGTNSATKQWAIRTSDDEDLRFEYGSTLAAEAMRIDGSNGNVDIGSAAGSEKLSVAGSFTTDGYIYPTTNGGWSLGLTGNRWGAGWINIVYAGDIIANGSGGLSLQTDEGTKRITVFDSGDVVINDVSAAVNFRVESDDETHALFVDGANDAVCIGKSSDSITEPGSAFSNLQANGHHYLGICNTETTSSNSTMYINRQDSDGDLIVFRQANTTEGTIAVSGSTVSYNGFAGRHESSGIATNTAIGTVVSTIDELDVYPDTQPDINGGEIPSPKAGQTRADHAKVKVSDAVGDARVYGVVAEFTAQGKAVVTSVGIGSVKVTGACAGGDLLESNGDGTAKVQSDDIIRSSTIGKVTIGNSDTGVKLVSCVLYCG